MEVLMELLARPVGEEFPSRSSWGDGWHAVGKPPEANVRVGDHVLAKIGQWENARSGRVLRIDNHRHVMDIRFQDGEIKTIVPAEHVVLNKPTKPIRSKRWDRSRAGTQGRRLHHPAAWKQANTDTDPDSWRLAPHESLLEMFEDEMNQCKDLMKRFEQKVKQQRREENIAFVERLNQAALLISQTWKKRNLYKRIMRRVYMNKIVSIQCWFRCQCARTSLHKMKAALLIQRTFKTYRAKTFVSHVRTVKHAAATHIQRVARGRRARLLARTQLPFHLRILKYHDERMAALCIQKAVKMFLARVAGRRLMLLNKAAALKSKRGRKHASTDGEISELLESYSGIRDRKDSTLASSIGKEEEDSPKPQVTHHTSHIPTLGGCTHDVAQILEKKAKQDKLDRKNGHAHPPFAHTVADFFQNEYGVKLGKERHKMFLNDLGKFHSRHIRIRWFAICLGQNTYTQDGIVLNTGNNRVDRCFFPYRAKAIGVVMRIVLAVIPGNHIGKALNHSTCEVSLKEAKLAIRRAFSENEDITTANIQEKLIASVEAKLREHELMLENTLKVDFDQILDLCMRQWYALELKCFSQEAASESDPAATSLHITCSHHRQNDMWGYMSCTYCQMIHMCLEDHVDTPEGSDAGDNDWDIPLAVERWDFEQFEPTVLHGTGINHERIVFESNRVNAKRAIKKYLGAKASPELKPLEPIVLTHERL